MRLAVAASYLCLCLPVIAFRSASPQAPAPVDTTPAASPQPTSSGTVASGTSDAAEKHARRMACLQEAKSKKLVGADKTEFLRACNAAP